jgi:CheY-like chemotaxis protein
MVVLVVDDDDFFRDILSQSLNLYGLSEVPEAENSKVALEKVQQKSHPFECILMDIQMPDLTGIEVCRRIKSVESYANDPIVMISSISDDSQKKEAFEAGARSFIAKPFEIVDIGARVKQVTQKPANNLREAKLVAREKTRPWRQSPALKTWRRDEEHSKQITPKQPTIR